MEKEGFRKVSELRCTCHIKQLLGMVGFKGNNYGVQIRHADKIDAFIYGPHVVVELGCQHCKREHKYTLKQRALDREEKTDASN